MRTTTTMSAQPSRSALLGGLAATVIGLLGAPGPAGAAVGTSAHPAAIRSCTPAQTRVWLGDGPGGGTAGTVYYPLEFSNVGRVRCTLDGYPGVSAYGSAGRRIGKPATRNPGSHATVTLAPGATAHAILGIRDWGAICSRQLRAQGLRVTAPGERTATPIGFPFGACASASVLVVEPVRPGVGIPGATTR